MLVAQTQLSSQSRFVPNISSQAARPFKALMLAPVLFASRASAMFGQGAMMRGAVAQSAFEPHLFQTRQLQTPTESTPGRLECPCVPLNQTTLEGTDVYDQEAGCFYLQQPQGTYCYPLNYGLEGCQVYDKDLEPFCDKEGFPGNPDWCAKAFCYVDKNNCDLDNYPSTYFEGLTYSYQTCGNTNTFIDMINDMENDIRPSVMELVAVTEREVVSMIEGVEDNIDAIKTFSKNQQQVDDVCTVSNSCGPILEGRENACWGGKVDFYGVNMVLDEQKQRQSSQQDLNLLSCLARELETTMLNAADSQHDNKNRTAYLYYGDQNTGALVEYPELQICTDNYDARFRPWYASAVSGPKDVVAVIDVSGSMQGNRILLARQAADAVIDTLTWADRVTLITFNEGVASKYSTDLVKGTEENIEKMSAWIESNFNAGGGTNFMAPLEEAYDMLEQNKDANDQKTCSQAILFLTDGDAPFDREKMTQLVEKNPEAVVFTYGLGADAKASALQEIACMTNGLFHPVNNEASLARMMSSYYEYYAGLQDTGKISWIRYQDAFSGVELIAACGAMSDYDQTGMTQPDLVGVACMDLNIIVDPATLKTCDNNAYNFFIDQIFREATQCSSKGGKIYDECTLQNMRQKISPKSLCLGQVSPKTCQIPAQPNASDFSGLDPERFRYIPLEGCEKQNITCESGENKPGKGPGSSGGLPIGVIAGAAGGGMLLLVGALCLYKKRKQSAAPQRPSRQERPSRPVIQNEYFERPSATAPGYSSGPYGGEVQPIPVPSAPMAPSYSPARERY